MLEILQEGEYDWQIAAIQHINYEQNPGESSIESGGIGHNYVEMKIVSQRGNGINSTVTVFRKL